MFNKVKDFLVSIAIVIVMVGFLLINYNVAYTIQNWIHINPYPYGVSPIIIIFIALIWAAMFGSITIMFKRT